MEQIDKHCGAKTRTGGTCGKPAGWGTDHLGGGRCKHHGGSTPTGRTAGRQQLAQKAITTTAWPIPLTRINPESNPADALARLAGLLRMVVDQLGDAALNPVDDTGRLSPRWVAWRESLRDLRATAKMMLDAGVEERQVRLAEAQGAKLAQVIRDILADLDLTPEQQARVPVVVPRRLREMEERIRQLEQEHSKM